MMTVERYILIVLMLIALGLGAIVLIPSAHAQVAACSDPIKLSWVPNTEEDMDVYRLYWGVSPDVSNAGNPVTAINHIGSIVNENGVSISRYQAMLDLPEAEVFFGLTAVDKAGNESVMSDVVSCVHDTVPGIPQQFQFIISTP